MDFSLAEERRLLQDTVRRFLANEYKFEKRRAIISSPDGFSRDIWKQLADLGLLGLTMRDEDGGMAGDAFDTSIVMEAFGRALVIEPYVATVVLGARDPFRRGQRDAQREAWLGPVAAGEKLLAFAHTEPAARYAPSFVETKAKREGAGWKLDGFKSVVLERRQRRRDHRERAHRGQRRRPRRPLALPRRSQCAGRFASHAMPRRMAGARPT